MSKITASPNWRYRLSIKDSFEDEVTPELVVKLLTRINKQLAIIQSKVNSSSAIDSDEQVSMSDKLTECIDSFEFACHLSDGTISADDWHAYSFDGDFEELINDSLNHLYDLADERILLKNNTTEKLIWVD